MDLRLIATDIDGTLLGSDGIVTQRTVDTLRAAHDAGIEVVAATGRSHWSALPLIEPVGCIRWLLASNGATLFDLSTGQIVEQSLLERATVHAVVTKLTSEFAGLGFSWETAEGVFQDEAFRAIRSSAFPSRKIARRSTVEFEPGADDLAKMMVLHPTLADTSWLEASRPYIPAALSFATSGLGFIEITSALADKGTALSSLCDRLGVAQEHAITFGDQVNDLGMLRWAGRGYAMANAHEEAIEAASHRAPHHHDDGVAQIVEQLLTERPGT